MKSGLIEFLTHGVDITFPQIPQNKRVLQLLEGLKRCGFVSLDTKLEHFLVLFGIPLHISQTPFERIKWKKNVQLYRYFLDCMFGESSTPFNDLILFHSLFANKHGENINYPQIDKKRLEQSSDFETLRNLLKEFYG